MDYFKATIALFKTLPTYEALAAAGVTPSNSRTWIEDEIQAPLKEMHGAAVTLRCKGKVLNEVWYHFSVRGSVQTGEFIAAEPDGAKNSCPGTGIRYLSKGSSERGSSTVEPTRSQPATVTSLPTSTATPFAGRGFLQLYVKGESSHQGCLISTGTWYMSGTCASFRAQEDVVHKLATKSNDQKEPHMFTLLSSKGPCGIIKDKFQCRKNLAMQTIFSTTRNGTLSYQNHTSFYANAVPRRFEKADISIVRETGNADVEVEIRWSGIDARIQAQDEL